MSFRCGDVCRTSIIWVLELIIKYLTLWGQTAAADRDSTTLNKGVDEKPAMVDPSSPGEFRD